MSDHCDDPLCNRAQQTLRPEVFAAEVDRHCPSLNPARLSARDELNLELLARQGRILGERAGIFDTPEAPQ